jgi:hypothetical protein
MRGEMTVEYERKSKDLHGIYKMMVMYRDEKQQLQRTTVDFCGSSPGER